MRALDKIVNFLLLKLSINTYPHIKYIIQNTSNWKKKKSSINNIENYPGLVLLFYITLERFKHNIKDNRCKVHLNKCRPFERTYRFVYHTHTHTHTNACTHKLMHMHAHTCTHTLTYMQTSYTPCHTHCTHTHTHWSNLVMELDTANT